MAFSSSPARPAVAEIPSGMIPTGALIDAADALESLTGQQMAAPVAARIIKLIKWAAPAVAGYQSERNEIVQRFGVATGDGRFNIAPENVAPYNAALSGLRGEPTAPPPASLQLQISAMADTQITPALLSKLDAFVRD